MSLPGRLRLAVWRAPRSSLLCVRVPNLRLCCYCPVRSQLQRSRMQCTAPKRNSARRSRWANAVSCRRLTSAAFCLQTIFVKGYNATLQNAREGKVAEDGKSVPDDVARQLEAEDDDALDVLVATRARAACKRESRACFCRNWFQLCCVPCQASLWSRSITAGSSANSSWKRSPSTSRRCTATG